MKDRQQESLCAKRDGSSREDSEAGPLHKGKPPGGQKTEGGDPGRGGGDAAGGGPAERKGSMEKAQGMVQDCGQPCTAACSSYARVDHGGSGRTCINVVYARPTLFRSVGRA